MKEKELGRTVFICLICGMLGAVLMCCSDWIMIYGNTAYEGKLVWLTLGVLRIAPWRNSLAMFLAFPAVILYTVGLYAVRNFFEREYNQKTYLFLTAVGLTPWLCIHLFYTMIFYISGWFASRGETAMAYEAGEALVVHFSWIIPIGEILMILPFLYIFLVTVTEKSIFSRWMALNNPLLLFLLLKGLSAFFKDTPAGLAFTNGLMSESMILWFLIYFIAASLGTRRKRYR